MVKSTPQVFDKVPERNSPCLCGSGKKYKKCCA
nr:SEC-C metal-binding domain-containing protein [Pseudoalteromonas nigrifaciens]